MAEGVGLAISIASLYNACIDITARLDAYKNFELESQVTTTYFEALKVKLQDWADGVGIRNGELVDDHDSRLDDPKRVPIIRKALEYLKKLLERVEHTTSSIKLPLRQRSAGTDRWILPFDEDRSKDEHRQPLSKRSRMYWSMGKKEKLNKDVVDFERLVNVLYHVADPTRKGTDRLLESTLSPENHEPLFDSKVALKEMWESLIDLDRRDILEWLDALKNDDEHGKHISSHLDGTCKWVLSHPAYVDWESDPVSDSGAKFLWIHGPAGFGKTVLSAWLVRHVEGTLNFPIAHCFSSSHARSTDEFDNVIRTWITQLAQCDTYVLGLCSTIRRKQSARRASRQDAWNLLREVSSQVPSCVFILDGLDEFSSADDARSNFLRDIKKAVTSTKVKVLITSRDEVDIESELIASPTQPQENTMLECKITEDHVRDDVDLYSQYVVAKKFIRQDELSRRELSAQIAEKASGMFLWIKLQQHQFRNTQSKKFVQGIIQGMPQGLHQTYKRNWDSIQEAPEPDRNRAVNILRWLTFGYRTFTVQEMTEALIVELDEASEAFCEDDLPAEIDSEYSNNEIKGPCRSLVELRDVSKNSNPQLNMVHLVHASVREFLRDTLPAPTIVKPFPSTGSHNAVHHVILAAYCLRYLNCPQAWNRSHDKDSDSLREDADSFDKDSNSFTGYAVYWWFSHLRESEEYYDIVSGLVHDFMRPENVNFRNWRQEIEPQNDNASAMYYASAFGLLRTMDFLHSNGDDIDSVGGLLGTALQAACAEGHGAAFDRLMKWGADVTVEGGLYHNAVNAAAYCGRDRMVKALLDRETVTDLLTSQGRKAIRTASEQGHLDIVRLLLDHSAVAAPDASVIERSAYLSDSLLGTAKTGHAAIARLLLERGANSTASDDYKDTPLHVAAANNHIEVVKLLLEQEPFSDAFRSPNNSAALQSDREAVNELIEKRGLYGTTPLHRAAEYGNIEIVALLLRRGANINAQSVYGDTPLLFALVRQHFDVATLLLDQKADMNVGDAEGYSAVHIAAERGFDDIILLLIERGADLNTRNQIGATPLHIAIWSQNGADNQQRLKVVKLLLEYEADVNIRDAKGWNAVHIAAGKGLDDIVLLLIERGADLNARSRGGATPLHFAVFSEGIANQQRLNVVELLLQHKAVYCADNEGFMPLHLAAQYGHNQIVSLFLDQGHSIDARNEWGSTPLHRAVRNSKVDTVQLLLHRGADPTVHDTYGCTPLHIAARRGNLDIVRRLIANGCDINAKTKDGSTPLRNTIESASDELIEYLIQKGADLFATDQYGMTCLDWLRRLRPHLHISERIGKELDNVVSGPDIIVLRRNTSERAAVIRKDIQKGKKELYDLSKALVMLNMESDARLARQARILVQERGSLYVPYCDVCNTPQNREDPFYACKDCLETDLCHECMIKYEDKPLLDYCHNHEFLKIVASEAKIRPDQTEAFDEWLLGIEEQLRPTDSNESTHEHA
ncbi:MAG: hypothetical protein Q9225_001426 [Loekoesia sp. 1 TL-2023]